MRLLVTALWLDFTEISPIHDNDSDADVDDNVLKSLDPFDGADPDDAADEKMSRWTYE